MGRYIFNGVTVLSLLVCVAFMFLWLSSMTGLDGCSITYGKGQHVEITSNRGTLSVTLIDNCQGACGDPDSRGVTSYSISANLLYKGERPWFVEMSAENWHAGTFGVRLATGTFRIASRFRQIEIAYWILALVFGIWPLVRLSNAIRQRALRRQWVRRGLCPKCHYDLRATPDRCPECGTASQLVELHPRLK